MLTFEKITKMNEIAQNIAEIKARMAEACKKAGRNPEEVKLLLATGRRRSYIVPYYLVLNLLGPIFLLETAAYLSNC